MSNKTTIVGQIYEALELIRCGTCAQIAVHCRLTYVDVEKNINGLVRTKKVKKLHVNATRSPRGKRSNVYALADFKGEWTEQVVIGFVKKKRGKA